MRIAMSKGTSVVVGGLLTAALAGCSSGSGSDAAGVDTPPSPSRAAGSTPASEAAPDTVSEFSDSFDDDRNGWALPPSEHGTTTVVDGDFVWESKLPLLRPHLIAGTLGRAFDEGRLAMTDVVVRASVTPQRGDAAVGVFCREVPDTDADFQWYEFVVRDGYAAIRQADLAGNLDVLAESEDVRLPVGQTAEITGTCVDSTDDSASLELALDGQSVLTTEVEDPLGNGVAGLQAYDAAESADTERFLISWHDFAVGPA